MTSKDGSSIRRTRANQWKLQGESKPPSRGAGDVGVKGGWVGCCRGKWVASIRFVLLFFFFEFL